jgi:hypothetical protein
VFQAGRQKHSKEMHKYALIIDAEQEEHPSVLHLSKLKVQFPDTMTIHMNDLWVFVVQAVAGHIYSYLGSADALSAAELIRPMQSELARVESTQDTVYMHDLQLSEISARVSFERTSDFPFPVPALPQWLKFSVDSVAVDLMGASVPELFGTWSTAANIVMQHESPQIKQLGMDIIVNSRWNVLSWKDWAGRKDGSQGREFGDLFRIGLMRFTGATSKSLQDLGFDERPLTNKDIFDLHWKELRKCDSQQEFDHQINHLIFDWDSNHCGLESRACVAVGIVNRSSQEIKFSKLDVRKGSNVKYLQRSILAMPPPAADGTRPWQPAQSNILFAWGYAVSPIHSGDVELLVECDAFTALLTNDGGAHFFADAGIDRARSSFTCNFVTQETHKW